MAQLVTVDSKILEDILSNLKTVNRNFKRLEKKVDSLEPIYGSSAWWEKETKEALEEYKRGEGEMFSSIEELNKHLDSLKPADENSITS